MEGRNVGTIKGYGRGGGGGLKQGLNSAKDLTIKLPEGLESAYHRLD